MLAQGRGQLLVGQLATVELVVEEVRSGGEYIYTYIYIYTYEMMMIAFIITLGEIM